jgi:hypothetical protein
MKSAAVMFLRLEVEAVELIVLVEVATDVIDISILLFGGLIYLRGWKALSIK